MHSSTSQLANDSHPDGRASAIKAQIFRAKSLWSARPKVEPVSNPTGQHEHGAWCKLKKSIKKHLHPPKDEALVSKSTTPYANLNARASCLHKFKHGQCKRCLAPESECERLQTGFSCFKGGCIYCKQPSLPKIIDSEVLGESVEVEVDGGKVPLSATPQLPPIRPVSKVVDDMIMSALGTSLTDSKFSADSLDASSSTGTHTTRDTSISSLPSFDDYAADASSPCPPPRNRSNRHAIIPDAHQLTVIRMTLGQFTEPQTAPTETPSSFTQPFRIATEGQTATATHHTISPQVEARAAEGDSNVEELFEEGDSSSNDSFVFMGALYDSDSNVLEEDENEGIRIANRRRKPTAEEIEASNARKRARERVA
ncbi:hypothetical protein BCR34DRAFT_613544 [Clohesyomyces aquaticus]|uniref:Uncharacterized protein n=1 Tax=Clohesyomyces aquaticus TaxID=1231657 RepID=A0A1Y1ZTQ1_9PLEO|nr:hypothetical protein BCR34DRAFT_613544 [Clohesyomyces aquaticus]